jgi:signal transduction histidine kinase
MPEPDTTARGMHESQLEDLREQVNHLQEQLQEAHRRADRKDSEQPAAPVEVPHQIPLGQLSHLQRLAAIGTLSTMIAHEFNNILTPMINYAYLARQNPSLVDKALNWSAEGGERATRICRAILGMFRGESATAERLALNDIIEDMLAATARPPEKDGIELNREVSDDTFIEARRIEFQQVLLNLYTNARRALLDRKGPRRITILARNKGDHVLIQFSDTGDGIAPENVERIFEPFFTTTDPNNPKLRGTGLGLTISRELLQNMGGTIRVESTPGEGTDFFIRMPA